MSIYGQMWSRSLRHIVFWIGIGFLLLTTVVDASISEEIIPQEFLKAFRLALIVFLIIGIIIVNLGFVKPLSGKTGGHVIGSLVIGSIIGLVAGFVVNSLFAEVFGYSLKTQEAPYCWMIIGITAILVGSFFMYGRFKERLLAQRSKERPGS